MPSNKTTKRLDEKQKQGIQYEFRGGMSTKSDSNFLAKYSAKSNRIRAECALYKLWTGAQVGSNKIQYCTVNLVRKLTSDDCDPCISTGSVYRLGPGRFGKCIIFIKVKYTLDFIAAK